MTATSTAHRIVVPGWHPTTLNELLGHWRKRHRLKKADRDLIAVYARLALIPPAAGKRRVSLVLTLARGQRAGDPDSYWKSVLDALVQCGLLVDDNRQSVELGTVEFARGTARQTEIVFEDLVPGERGTVFVNADQEVQRRADQEVQRS
jgi:hypothetical protein